MPKFRVEGNGDVYANTFKLHVRQPFAYWVNEGTCRVNRQAACARRRRVQSESGTPVVFLMLSYDTQIAYEVRAAALVQGTSSSRILSNTGNVTLVRNSNQPGEPDTVIATFPMPFELTFTKVAAAP